MDTTTRTMPSASEIKDMAGISQRRCGSGSGYRLCVFSDGMVLEAVSENDVIARGNGSDGWESPVMVIARPMSMAEIRAELAEAGFK